MANKLDSERKCGFCKAPMNTSAAFCSSSCFETNCDYLLIEISPRWVKRRLSLIKCDKTRFKIVSEYAKRHSFDFDLLTKRLQEKFNINVCRGTR